MENYPISISLDKAVHHFEIGEYLHQSGESCKVKVFQQGKLMASFEPDDYNYLHICQNPGNLDEQLLHVLADQIEAHHPHSINKPFFGNQSAGMVRSWKERETRIG